jgi:CRISPR/Cas system-associated endoribonuclease Cas2
MKQQDLKKIKDGRIDRLRRHLFDASLTPKQRRELRSELRRRERLANERLLNKQLKNRINASIRASHSPHHARVTASRYKNAMTNAQRENLKNQLVRVSKNAEHRHVRQFYRNGNHVKLLDALRNLRRTVMQAHRAMKK